MSALKASENFEPSSEWVDEEAFRTLLVHLPGFKREQIKAQITTTGHINISGERPLEGQRWSKFTVEYPLPEHCKVEETQAKFENETLYVRFSIDLDEVASPLVPTPTMHKSPSSSPMERTTTELGEKAQERNGKNQKAAPEGEKAQERNGKSQKAAPEEQKLQQKQKQLEAKKEIDRNEQPKATGTQEKKHGTLQDKERSEEGKQHETLQDKERSEEGKQPKATGTQEKKHETLQDKERSEEGKQPKATSNQEKKHETLQDKERSEEGRSNSDKIQGQQMGPALETDDTSILAKAPYSTISFRGLPPAEKTLLANVAVAGLMLLGIGFYLTYKYGGN